MGNKPDMYAEVRLTDGREGTVVDFMGDMPVIDTVDNEGDWTTILAFVAEDGSIVPMESDGETYNLCVRKQIRLHITEDLQYTFLFADRFAENSYRLDVDQYTWLCELLDINKDNFEESWKHHFEYNNLTMFLNAYKIVTADEFYYAYGYDAEEKTADALYRFYDGNFERYFPLESVWRKMPEQRMILKEKNARYQRVSKTEGLSLALFV